RLVAGPYACVMRSHATSASPAKGSTRPILPPPRLPRGARRRPRVRLLCPVESGPLSLCRPGAAGDPDDAPAGRGPVPEGVEEVQNGLRPRCRPSSRWGRPRRVGPRPRAGGVRTGCRPRCPPRPWTVGAAGPRAPAGRAALVVPPVLTLPTRLPPRPTSPASHGAPRALTRSDVGSELLL